MSKRRDHAAPIPLRFTEALRADEIDGDEYVLGCYVAALCYEAKNTAGGVATVRLSDLAGLLDLEDEHVRRKLRRLHPDWIEAETRRGPNAVWRIRLTGLVWRNGDEDGSPPNFHRISSESTPSEWKLISTEPDSGEGANPHEQRESPTSESPLRDSRPTDTRHDTTRKDRTACSEDDVESEAGLDTPRARKRGDTTDRLLDALDRVGRDREPAQTRDSEDGLLAECEAMVRAGKARWID